MYIEILNDRKHKKMQSLKIHVSLQSFKYKNSHDLKYF